LRVLGACGEKLQALSIDEYPEPSNDALKLKTPPSAAASQ
jgi:hypothetical protein